jgi:hypothetical protein
MPLKISNKRARAHKANQCFPLRRAYLFTFMQFLFSLSLHPLLKARIGEHYGHVYALSIANVQVCFMNGSMIEHDGLGIAFFSVGILKDMVAC